jgi:hypothetical protein
MVEVLQSQELPASLDRRLEEQLRKSALAKEMDGALTQKGSRRRRRRSRGCSSGQTGAMAGGAAGVAAGFLTCAFTFVGCFAVAPFMVTVGTKAVLSGACDCWSDNDLSRTGCAAR